jgi:hypothetical protein
MVALESVFYSIKEGGNTFIGKFFPTGAWGKIFAKVSNFHLQKTQLTYVLY